MLRGWPIVAAAILLVPPTGISQDVAPEVLLLSRIKRHLHGELARVPNYTCIETISRFYEDPKSPFRSHWLLAALDTVRLEIVFTGRREWYGSPGAQNLSAEHPLQFVGSGMVGDGAFGYTLNNLVEGARFTYRGQETLGGRKAVRFDFSLPRSLNFLTISMQGGVGAVGEEGSIWVDSQSLDLIRVESHATEIPPFLSFQEERMNVDYARMRIGDSDTMLAQMADSLMRHQNGQTYFNRMEFSHCRSYAATSRISFDAQPEAATEAPDIAPAPAVARPAVPPFLKVTVLLTTPVLENDAVGTLIQGKVSGNVVRKRKVVVPDGSVIHGRIRRLEHYPDRRVFVVGLEFMDIDVHGESLLFYADLLRADKDPQIEAQLSGTVLVPGLNGVKPTGEVITLPELPGVASFFVKGDTLKLPVGFRLTWMTRGLIH
jgi:hypothetical protein